MKKSLHILFILLLVTAYGRTQGNVVSVRDSIFTQMNGTLSDVTITKMGGNTIVCTYIDTFTVSRIISPSYVRPQKDTLLIKLTFEENWSPEIIEKTKAKNSEIITPIANRFIEHMDSLQWRGIKTNKSMFLNDKVQELRWYYGAYLGNKNGEMDSLKQLVRLPDFTVQNYGVFMECSPEPHYMTIVEEEIMKLYMNVFSDISKKVFKATTVVYGHHSYE